MLFASDDDGFPVKCPHCKNEFYEKIRSLKANGFVRCTDAGCQTLIRFPKEQFLRVLADARQSPHNFFRQFLRLRPSD